MSNDQRATISENLETLKSWNENSSKPQPINILSMIKSGIFVSCPIVVIGLLGFVLFQGAQSGTDGNCICPDGGVRANIPKYKVS